MKKNNFLVSLFMHILRLKLLLLIREGKINIYSYSKKRRSSTKSFFRLSYIESARIANLTVCIVVHATEYGWSQGFVPIKTEPRNKLIWIRILICNSRMQTYISWRHHVLLKSMIQRFKELVKRIRGWWQTSWDRVWLQTFMYRIKIAITTTSQTLTHKPSS